MSTRTHMGYAARAAGNHGHLGLCSCGCGKPVSNAKGIRRECDRHECIECKALYTPTRKNTTRRCRRCADKFKNRQDGAWI